MEKEITVAKLMVLRNRAVNKINECKKVLEKYNSILEDGDWPVDLVEVMTSMHRLRDFLITAKSLLIETNVSTGFAGKIIRLSELKSEKSFLNSIPTDEGQVLIEQAWSKASEKVQKKAVFSYSKIIEKIKDISSEENLLEEEIGLNNFQTHVKIDIPEDDLV